jgi:hypothetical protein
VGDFVDVDLSCDFKALTPIISGLIGSTFRLQANSEFRVRAGDVAGLPDPTRIPPIAPPSASPSASATASPIACSVVADFTGSPTSGSGGSLTVTFAGSAAITGPCTVTSWAWNFGDGQTSTQQNPVHLFTKTNQGGNQMFTVQLTVTLSNGASDGESKNNYIRVNR